MWDQLLLLWPVGWTTLTSEAMQMVTGGTHHNCVAFMDFQNIQMAKTHHQHFSPSTAGLCYSILILTEIINRSCRTQSNPPLKRNTWHTQSKEKSQNVWVDKRKKFHKSTALLSRSGLQRHMCSSKVSVLLLDQVFFCTITLICLLACSWCTKPTLGLMQNLLSWTWLKASL